RISLSLLITASILILCKRRKPEFIRVLDENATWTSEFASRYPDPLPGFTEKPQLGTTGNLGVTKDLHFLLRKFPAERLEELETFVVPKLLAQGLDSVTILAFVPTSVPTAIPDAVEKVTLKYYRDGTIEDSRVTGVHASIPRANINGRPINVSEH